MKTPAAIFRIILFALILISLSSCISKPIIEVQGFKKVDVIQLRREAGQAYAVKNYQKAVQLYGEALTYNQDDVTIAYNLACCYAVLGDAKNAAIYVTQAFGNGLRNFEHFQNDSDFDNVRKNSGFSKTIIDVRKNFESIGELKYVESRSLQPYRIRIPNNYDPKKSYPLLIGMHGMGGNADGFIAIYDELEAPQIIYVTPEGQYRRTNDIAPQWYTRSWAITNQDQQLTLQADPLVAEYILNTIQKVSQD